MPDITLKAIKNPICVAEDGSRIDCTLVLPNGQELPFTASSSDPESHGRDLHQALTNGVFGAVAAYVPPPPPPAKPATNGAPRDVA